MKRINAIILFAAAALVAPAAAQSGDSGDGTNRDQGSRQQPAYGLDWDSTTVVGYDFDGDGTTDAYYSTTRYDVERLRRQVRDQQNRMSQGDRDRTRSAKSQRPGDASSAPQRRTIEGTVKEVRTFNLTGQGQPCRVARVQTKDGRHIAVLLGSAQGGKKLGLEPGDSIKVRSYKGSIDNRKVLVADRITVDGKSYTLNPRRTEDLKRIKGSIIDTRTTSLRMRDGTKEECLLLKMRDAGGRTHSVLLGPTSRVDPDRFSAGEEVSVLAAPTRINGHQAYAARRISHDGQSRQLSPLARRDPSKQ